jgi:PBSX family phage terminase large subunit
MIQVSLTQKQAEFLTSDAYATLFVAGVGSGKSFIGSHWAKEKTLSQPWSKGFIGANTYNQLRNATLATFFNVLDEHHIKFKYNQQRNIITIGYTQVYAYSLDNYKNIRGIEIGWAWLDETRDTKREAFDVILGRMRDRRTNKRQIKLTSSPCGFNWLYDYFVGPSKNPKYRCVQGSSHENPFLPEGYVESLKESYDSKMYQQEVLGEFVSTGTGQVYYAFDRSKHVAPVTFNPNHRIQVGMDFNVNPMTAVVFQAYDNRLYVLDEVYLMTSDTHQMGLNLIASHGQNLRVIPDSTGNSRKTSAKGQTDHSILKDLGLEVIYNHNPARFDRYVCVNNLCEKSRLVIDPKCKNLIKDLEKLSYKTGTTEPDVSSDKSLGHISDALGYGAWFSYPIVKPSSGVSMSTRGYG